MTWITKRLGPAAKTLAAGEVEAFASATEVAAVGFFAADDSESLNAYSAVALNLDEVPFAFTTDAEAAAGNRIRHTCNPLFLRFIAAGVTAPAVVLYKKFDEGKNVLTGDLAEKKIAQFVELNRFPLVVPFSMEVVSRVFQVPSITLFGDITSLIVCSLPLGSHPSSSPTSRSRASLPSPRSTAASSCSRLPMPPSPAFLTTSASRPPTSPSSSLL